MSISSANISSNETLTLYNIPSIYLWCADSSLTCLRADSRNKRSVLISVTGRDILHNKEKASRMILSSPRGKKKLNFSSGSCDAWAQNHSQWRSSIWECSEHFTFLHCEQAEARTKLEGVHTSPNNPPTQPMETFLFNLSSKYIQHAKSRPWIWFAIQNDYP